MKAIRWWRSWRWAAFAVVLAVLGCGGESKSSSAGSDDGRGGDDSGGSGPGGRGGSDSGGSGRGGTVSGGSGGTEGPGTGGITSDVIVLEDHNNYTATNELSIPIVETAPEEVTICWTDVTSDLACDEVNPETDIDAAELLTLRTASEATISELLSSGMLELSQVDGYVQYESDGSTTCADLSSFSSFGTAVDPADYYVENPDRGYLFTVNRGAQPLTGTASMVLARPVSSSANRRIDMPPGCGLQTLVAELEGADPVSFPYDVSGLLYYGDLTRDGLGNALQQGDLDTLVLYFFAGAALADLEANVLRLDSIATESFRLELTGSRTVSLYDAINPETGMEFAGFRRAEAGIWLLRLSCSACTATRPPEVIAVIEPF